MNYSNLNNNELAVLKAIVKAADDYAGGDFTYATDIERPSWISKNQLSGYIAQLVTKEYISVDLDGADRMITIGNTGDGNLNNYTFEDDTETEVVEDLPTQVLNFLKDHKQKEAAEKFNLTIGQVKGIVWRNKHSK
jgi:hypothetical protein